MSTKWTMPFGMALWLLPWATSRQRMGRAGPVNLEVGVGLAARVHSKKRRPTYCTMASNCKHSYDVNIGH